MSNPVATILLVGFFLLVVLIAATESWILSDYNTFLKEFVGPNLLNVLGVILAITLASIANIHLELRLLEQQYRFKDGINSIRNEIRKASIGLISVFGLAFLLAVAKPIVSVNESTTAFMNGLGLLALFFNILVMTAIVRLVF